MRVSIEVKDRKEADRIRRGLADPGARAFLEIIGELSKLPTDRARRRVLEFVADQIDEDVHG